jgi:hypothetical protein
METPISNENPLNRRAFIASASAGAIATAGMMSLTVSESKAAPPSGFDKAAKVEQRRVPAV